MGKRERERGISAERRRDDKRCIEYGEKHGEDRRWDRPGLCKDLFDLVE